MNFVDRISQYPGKIKLTDGQGNSTYYTLERADEPTVEGTKLNAATLNLLMQTADYDTNDDGVVDQADLATNATMLNNQSASYYRKAADIIPNTVVKAIVEVTELPASPTVGTLYLVKE